MPARLIGTGERGRNNVRIDIHYRFIKKRHSEEQNECNAIFILCCCVLFRGDHLDPWCCKCNNVQV